MQHGIADSNAAINSACLDASDSAGFSLALMRPRERVLRLIYFIG